MAMEPLHDFQKRSGASILGLLNFQNIAEHPGTFAGPVLSRLGETAPRSTASHFRVGVSSGSSVISANSASRKEPHLFNHVMGTLTPHPVTSVKQSLYLLFFFQSTLPRLPEKSITETAQLPGVETFCHIHDTISQLSHTFDVRTWRHSVDAVQYHMTHVMFDGPQS